jgi:phage FluMu protein Com
MHGNIATAWEETDSDKCPRCKAVRQEWYEIMDDTKTIRMRSDGEEVSGTTEKPKYKK